MSLDYTIYNKQIAKQKELGRLDALNLRSRSYELDGTQIIDEEKKIPIFDSNKDYSSWSIGSPVKELIDNEFQVFKLLQPYNAANYQGTPATLPAIWSICHTTNPNKAKPYIAPNGTSGMWMRDECCIENNHVWQSNYDNGVYSPTEYQNNWTDLGTIEEVGI